MGAQRYRESHGLYYDDFEVGDIYEHKPGCTIIDVDNIWQSLINSNNHHLHSDYHFASTTEFGRQVISSLVTFSIIGGLSMASTSGMAIANLGWKEVILSNPIFVGDTLICGIDGAQQKTLQQLRRPGRGHRHDSGS